MPPSSTPDEPPIVRAHPLARELARTQRAGGRVLDFGTGSGRNAAGLRGEGFTVDAVTDAAAYAGDPLPHAAFAAAIATHALLHGTPSEIAARANAIAGTLEPGARLYAVFGSVRDARYGRGTALGNDTFAPDDGDETGVAHAYFARDGLARVLAPFDIESASESGVDGIAGRWAHRSTPLSGAVHWFVVARRR